MKRRGLMKCRGASGRKRRSGESGFALLLVFVMAAAIAITLYIEVPRIAFESQRAREQMAIDRGLQYERAIQLFYRKYHTYPQTLDDLETTRNIRFLRRRYLDPLTGKDWRLLHVGPAGQLTDSLIQPAAPLPGSSTGSGLNATQGASQGFGSSQTSGSSQSSNSSNSNSSQLNSSQPADPNNPNDPNAQPPDPLNMALRRPSDRVMGRGAGFGGGTAGISGGDPVSEPPPGQEPDPNQPQPPVQQPYPVQPIQQPGQPIQQPGQPVQLPAEPGDPNQPSQPTQPGGQLPDPSLPQIPTDPGVPGQPAAPQDPTQPAQPGQPPVNPGSTPPGANSGQTPTPPLPVTGGVQPAGQSAGQLFSPGQLVGPAPVAGQQQQSASNLIQQILTTPRQPPSSIAGFTSGNTGGIAGVASTAEGKGIHKINDHVKYKEWEFVYDLKKDKTVVGAAAVNAQQNVQQQMQQNQSGTNSPFGSSGFGSNSAFGSNAPSGGNSSSPFSSTPTSLPSPAAPTTPTTAPPSQ